ncbi:MAG TPA: hypothetical protein VEJ00_02170, partial [Candidatus Acidoferrales bacterium]|nr:hypothetical protein [Candidatus Acidoferrales bacterium]
LVILGLCVLGVSASAQDIFKINYFANNGVSGAPDATVRIDNPGTASTENLCAMIYVFDNDQQLTECCGCLVTANGLRTLSVGKNLTNNPLTGVVSNNGVIKIVSSAPNNSPCEPASGVEPTPTVRAWASHIQNKVGSAYPVTETEFSDAALSTQEFSFNLEEQCFFAERLGSGHGICSCGTGD